MSEAAAQLTIEPYLIEVPDTLADEIADLAEALSMRLGEEPKDVRRGLEIAILSRGIAAIRNEEGKR